VTFIHVHDLHKTYRLGRVDVPVLRGADLAIRRAEWVAVLGASGSGKSTLLHLMGGLDRPDKANGKSGGGGDVVFDGRALSTYSAAELDRFRAGRVGFVFQFYHLLPELTVLENVLVAAMVKHGRLGYRAAAREPRARELLEVFGLAHRLRHRPAELSGGERQRVAIARALINDPDVLLADEPTGNLDRTTGEKILDAVAHLRAQRNQTIVMVTHDPQVAARADRVVQLDDGRVVAA
jgi:lipoprotein-releasing system ATP-binding protein